MLLDSTVVIQFVVMHVQAGAESAALGGLPIGWDWKTYLALNPDVAREMGNSQIAAEGHWRMYGRQEHRNYQVRPAPPPPRANALAVAPT